MDETPDADGFLPLMPGYAVDIEPRGRLRWLWSVIDEGDMIAASGVKLTEARALRAAHRWIGDRRHQ